MKEQLIDPISADFRNVHSEKDVVCGEVNAKNKMGAYVGFERFVVETVQYDALIDPKFDFGDLLSARDLCASMSSNAYSSSSATLSACSRVSELEVKQVEQQRFDESWTKNCEGLVARSVYRPPLEPAVTNGGNITGDASASEQPVINGSVDEPDDVEDTEGSATSGPPNEAGDPTQDDLNSAFPPRSQANET